MFFFKGLFNRLGKVSLLHDNKRIFLTFLLLSILFALYMMLVEGLNLIDTYYFLITTATTVGYGDISPSTSLGKIFVTVYMIVGIAIIGVFLGKVTDVMVELSSKRKRGLLAVKGKVDLIIAGYPGHEKVSTLVGELMNDERMQDARIVCVTNQITEKPNWMTVSNVEFVSGVASDSATLEKAGLGSAETVLILANDASTIESDNYSVAVCAVVEQLNSQCRTIVERVRKDELLFNIVNADTVVDVSTAAVLAQEILDPGAIELQNAIFSTHTTGTQFNYAYSGENKSWTEIATAVIARNAIPEGFRNPGEKIFNLLPAAGDAVKSDALIKYRSGSRLGDLF